MQEQWLIGFAVGGGVLLVIALVLLWRVERGLRQGRELRGDLDAAMAHQPLALRDELRQAQQQLGDRIVGQSLEAGERLRDGLVAELRQTRDAMQALHVALLQAQGEHARADRELLTTGLNQASTQLGANIETLTRTVNERLERIGGAVNERLDEGFRKTNETFANVMARLATIDEAQKKIDGLTTNVVSLQELLGDKRSRGAFGEVQLEALVRNILPPDSYAFQYTLPNNARADCVLHLPAPTGMVAVDAKFPLENYQRMLDATAPESDRRAATGAFRADVKRHIDAIAAKYLIADVTSDGAVMFVPAEAVFAEIHAYHPELVAHALQKRVWIVSPTTLMAVLNTARAVLKDVETRKQIHLIRDALAKLAKDFSRFDERMANLARHIDQAAKDVQDVQTSSRKISGQFARIEAAEIEALRDPATPALRQAADEPGEP